MFEYTLFVRSFIHLVVNKKIVITLNEEEDKKLLPMLLKEKKLVTESGQSFYIGVEASFFSGNDLQPCRLHGIFAVYPMYTKREGIGIIKRYMFILYQGTASRAAKLLQILCKADGLFWVLNVKLA